MITTKQQLTTFMESRDQYGIKPGLQRVEFLLQEIGHPEQELKAVHVAGTNGKGSVIQFMQNALMKNGYHVGVFTSPSFTGLEGHFLINGTPADSSDIINIVNEMIPAVRQLDQIDDGPTSFEIITVIAFRYFHQKVDIALIETGMGGRYDTTNCFRPLVSVITNIEKDHMQYLGNSIAEIAYHKAGIIKEEIPVVTGRLQTEAEKVIRKEAVRKQITPAQLGRDFEHKKSLYNWRAEELNNIILRPGLKGQHQKDNASVALSALHLLAKRSQFFMDQRITLKAFSETTLIGRFEQINNHPFIILDSAHNVRGIDAFIDTVEALDKDSDKRLLFAGFKDKQLNIMLEKLTPCFDGITVTSFDHERAASIANYRKSLNTNDIRMTDHWRLEIDHMLAQKMSDVHYYITGSMHFIMLVRNYILKNKR